MELKDLDLSVKYQFPVGYQPALIRDLAKIVEEALVEFDLGLKMTKLRTTDLSVDVQQALAKLANEIDQYKFINSPKFDSKVPYVTKQAEEIAVLRRDLSESLYRINGIIDNFAITRRIQLLQLTRFANYVSNTNDRHLTADGQETDDPQAHAGLMAIHNLEKITQYYDSVEQSSAVKALKNATNTVLTLKPTVSFGAIEFNEDESFERQPIVEF